MKKRRKKKKYCLQEYYLNSWYSLFFERKKFLRKQKRYFNLNFIEAVFFLIKKKYKDNSKLRIVKKRKLRTEYRIIITL